MFFNKFNGEKQAMLNEQLFDAVLNHNLYWIKSAIEAGADVNTPNKQGMLPIIHSVAYRDIETVEYLLQTGANPNLKDKNNKWASLHEAAYRGHLNKV